MFSKTKLKNHGKSLSSDFSCSKKNDTDCEGNGNHVAFINTLMSSHYFDILLSGAPLELFLYIYIMMMHEDYISSNTRLAHETTSLTTRK